MSISAAPGRQAISAAALGHGVFAVTVAALGVLGLIRADSSAILQPAASAYTASAALPYLCAFLLVAAGAGLLWARTAVHAARVLLVYLLIWFIVTKLPAVLRAPTVEGFYQSSGETAVLVAAAWVLYARLATGWERRRLGPVTGMGIARVLYAAALMAFGLSHFFYMQLTAPLVPVWLPPGGVVWGYVTGATYIAASLSVLSGMLAPLAAALTVLQTGLITVLVWPHVLVADPSPKQWSELFASWAITAGAWAVAGSYFDRPGHPSPGMPGAADARVSRA